MEFSQFLFVSSMYLESIQKASAVKFNIDFNKNYFKLNIFKHKKTDICTIK